MSPCSPSLNGMKDAMVKETASDFWLAIITTALRAGLSSLRRRHSGNIITTYRKCTARPQPRNANRLPMKRFFRRPSALDWLMFIHGIIMSRVILMIFKAPLHFLTKRFTCGMNLRAFPTWKEAVHNVAVAEIHGTSTYTMKKWAVAQKMASLPHYLSCSLFYLFCKAVEEHYTGNCGILCSNFR